jgi:hypothetical protein
MKLVCKAFANSKFAVIGKELVVSKDGVLEVEDHQNMVSTILMLKSAGFQEIKEESSEEISEESKEEQKEKTKKRYSRKQP